MKTVLLTGATGFVGSRVLTQLLAKGYDVLTLGRHAPKERVRAHLPADLRNPDAGKQGLRAHKDIPLLKHMAAAITTPSTPTDPVSGMRRDNVNTTNTRLEQHPDSGWQVVFVIELRGDGPPRGLPRP